MRKVKFTDSFNFQNAIPEKLVSFSFIIVGVSSVSVILLLKKIKKSKI